MKYTARYSKGIQGMLPNIYELYNSTVIVLYIFTLSVTLHLSQKTKERVREQIVIY